MVFTKEEVARLLSLPKEPKRQATKIDLKLNSNRLEMYCPIEPAQEFILDIHANGKIAFKVSLHHQEEPTHEGLIRIDYRGGHKNPEVADSHVPPFIAKYEGRIFRNEAHMHYFVEGYRSLAWAVPLTETAFPVKSIDSIGSFAAAVKAFATQINLSTSSFVVQMPLL